MSTRVHCFVLGSYTFTCREPVLIGKAIADARVDPSLQNAGLSWSRVWEAVQILPCESIAKLCAAARAVEIASDPQYGEGSSTSGGSMRGVPGFEGIGISVNEFFVGSRIVNRSVLSSCTP